MIDGGLLDNAPIRAVLDLIPSQPQPSRPKVGRQGREMISSPGSGLPHHIRYSRRSCATGPSRRTVRFWRVFVERNCAIGNTLFDEQRPLADVAPAEGVRSDAKGPELAPTHSSVDHLPMKSSDLRDFFRREEAFGQSHEARLVFTLLWVPGLNLVPPISLPGPSVSPHGAPSPLAGSGQHHGD
jgi:hypothetical protein